MTAIDCIDEIEIDASVEKVFETVRNYPAGLTGIHVIGVN